MTWRRQPAKQEYKSIYLNQFYDWVTGANTTAATFANNNTYTGLSAWTRNSGSLLSILGTENENDYGHIGVANGTTAVAAEQLKPAVNIQVELKPNGSGANTTGSSFFFRTRRHGSGAAWASATTDNGSLAAHYSFLSLTQSDSTYSGFAGGHDQVAIAGLAIGHGAGDIRGGTVNSPARVYAGYFEASVFSSAGQAIGAEIQVVNNSATAASHIDGGYPLRNTGLQLVSAINNTGSAPGSLYNAAYCKISTFTGSVNEAAYCGIFFEQNSCKEYLIDAYRATWGGTPPPFVRMANQMSIAARNSLSTLDLLLMRLDGNDAVEIFHGATGSSATDPTPVAFLLQNGNTNMAISPTGIIQINNTTSGTAPWATMTNTGATTAGQAPLFSPGAAGQPSGNTVTDWLRIDRAGVAVRFAGYR